MKAKQTANVVEEGKKDTKFPQEIQFIIAVLGIYGSYVIFGLLQEEINTSTYGPEKKKFKNTLFLLFSQCLLNCISAIVTLWVLKTPPSKVPMISYLPISLTYIGAMFCSNFAIEFVNYPTMVLAKSCKPIPVLLMGVLVLGKKPDLMKYIVVIAITAGIVIFTSDTIVSTKDHKENTYEGILLLAASLAMDGITGPFQDKLIHDHSPSSSHMMLYCNLWASSLVAVALVITGDGIRGLYFCMEHQEVILQIVLFSIAGAIGQNFIYYAIVIFSSLVCSLITTTRKFFTILVSVIAFGHVLTNLQWIGVSLVFAGLGLDLFNSTKKQVKRE